MKKKKTSIAIIAGLQKESDASVERVQECAAAFGRKDMFKAECAEFTQQIEKAHFLLHLNAIYACLRNPSINTPGGESLRQSLADVVDSLDQEPYEFPMKLAEEVGTMIKKKKQKKVTQAI